MKSRPDLRSLTRRTLAALSVVPAVLIVASAAQASSLISAGSHHTCAVTEAGAVEC